MANQDRDHGGTQRGHGCDHDHDHDCQHCGAPARPGLAACPYCRTAYPGITAGVVCPGCHCVNIAGRTVCAACKAALTRTCVFCSHVSPLDQPACLRCREVFEGAEERKRARDAARSAPGVQPTRTDPTGAQIFGSLADILKS